MTATAEPRLAQLSQVLHECWDIWGGGGFGERLQAMVLEASTVFLGKRKPSRSRALEEVGAGVGF